MKTQSPLHRLVQLRRKTEKIVIPKASWDLSNKQNCNITNLNETYKSKNNSSKKSSLDKKIIKKTVSMTNNVWQCTFKKINKNQQSQQMRKQKSMEKKTIIKKQKAKIHKQGNNQNRFNQKMNFLLMKAKNKESVSKLKLKYNQILNNSIAKSEEQKQTLMIFSQHLDFWINRCESLQKMLSFMNKTPKLDVMQIESENMSKSPSEKERSISENQEQQSVCSYIVDPKQQVKMKPIKKELKDQLHLNFAKVDYIRKKQYL